MGILILFLGFHFISKNRLTVYYFNFSNSQPIGIYRLIPLKGFVKNNDLVFIKVPQSVSSYIYGRDWLPEGGLLLKNVGGLPGDSYCITDTAFYINHKYIGPVSKVDSEGKTLPILRGTFKIREGDFLPVSRRISNSFDGRYFGEISLKLIQGKAVPVIVCER